MRARRIFTAGPPAAAGPRRGCCAPACGARRRRRHDPLPGRLELLQPGQELLGQPDVAQDQAGPTPGRLPGAPRPGSGFPGLGQGQAPGPPPVVHGKGMGGAQIRQFVVCHGDACRPAGRRGPGRLGPELTTDLQPHHAVLAPVPRPGSAMRGRSPPRPPPRPSWRRTHSAPRRGWPGGRTPAVGQALHPVLTGPKTGPPPPWPGWTTPGGLGVPWPIRAPIPTTMATYTAVMNRPTIRRPGSC